MRLILIIVLGSILIGATYAWSSTLDKGGEKVVDSPSQKITRPSDLPADGRAKTNQISQITANNITGHGGETAAAGQSQETSVTRIEEAREKARAQAGNADPFAPLEGGQPFPRLKANKEPVMPPAKGAGKVKQLTVVPPPPNSSDFDGMPGPHNGLVPPPVPGVFGANSGLATGLTIDQLPTPPDRPSTTRYMKLSAIIGNKAIFVIKDLAARKLNHWPEQVTLSPGDDFGSVKLLSIVPEEEKAIVEEHGRQEELVLPSVR